MTMSTSDENLVAENERLQLECINKDEEIVKVKYVILYAVVRRWVLCLSLCSVPKVSGGVKCTQFKF